MNLTKIKNESNSRNNGQTTTLKLTPEQETQLDTYDDPDAPPSKDDGVLKKLDEPLRTEVLSRLLRDLDFLKIHRSRIRPSHFTEHSEQLVCSITFDYFDRYTQLPSPAIAKQEVLDRTKDLPDKAKLEAETKLSVLYNFTHMPTDPKCLEDKVGRIVVVNEANIALHEFVDAIKRSTDLDGVCELLPSLSCKLDHIYKTRGLGWKKPLEIEDIITNNTSLPLFPINTIKDIVPEFYAIARDAAHYLQVPIDLPACLGLSTMGLPIAQKVKIQIRPSDTVPAIIWTFCVLRSGEMKSPTLRRIIAPIKEWESQIQERFQEEYVEKTTAIMSAKKRYEVVSKELTKLPYGDEGRSILESELIDLQKATGPQPIMPRLLFDDITSEAAAEILAQQNGAAGCIESEATFLEVAMGRYAGTPNLELYMKGWGGESYSVDRKKQQPVILPEVCLTLGLCVQPDVLLSIFRDPKARERGFIPRFLMACPKSKLGTRNRRITEAFPTSTTSAWRQLIFRLFQEYEQRTLTPNFDVVCDFETKYEPLLETNEELDPLAAWVGKAISGQMLRIAGVLHVASGKTSNQIEDNTLLAAIEITEYFLEHAKRVYLVGMNESVIEAANRIKILIQNSDEPMLLPRMISRGPGRGYDRETTDAALHLLEEAHVIREGPPNRNGNIQWEINPMMR
jgi:replicative DNA helicase